MAWKAWACALAMTAAGVAGCVSEEPTEGATASTPDEGRPTIYDALGATPADETAASSPSAPSPSPATDASAPAQQAGASAPIGDAAWVLTAVDGSPDGGLAAFEWTVPAGALVPWGFNEDLGTDERVVALEVAPLATPPAEVRAWGILFLAEAEEDGLETRSAHLRVPREVVRYGDTSGPAGASARALDEGASFVGIGDVEEGDRLRILVFAVTSGAAELGVAFRVLDHDPRSFDLDEEPAASGAAFVAARGGAPPVGLARTATGAGVRLHDYTDVLFGGYPAGVGTGVESRSGAPEIAWNVPPELRAAPGYHTLTARLAGQHDHGFAIASASYVGISVGASEALASVTLHGEDTQAGSLEAEAYPLLFGGVDATSFASVSARGDGDGPNGVTLDLRRAYAGGLVNLVSLGLIEFGATMEELFGRGIASEASSSASEGPVVVTTGPGGITFGAADGSTFTWAGGARDHLPEARHLLGAPKTS